MSADEPVVYTEWDLQWPAIPSRSRLYSLEPIGIGTPATESLTSYVSRLAEAHSVRVRELMMHELLPQRSLRSVAGTRRGWARQLGVAEGTVLEWRKGLTIPSLWCLLLVSSRLGISPLQLVCDQVGDLERTAESKARPDRPARVRTTIDPEAVQCALEAILASDEVPPPSLREVAERIGQTYTTLRHHLPELSRVIAARYRSYQEAQRARTRARVREEVRQAAIYLHQQGHYPSSNRIAVLISRPNSFRSPAQSARYEVLRELGWRA